jgi:hypothetical protein
MLDHAAVYVSDLEAGKRFYQQALEPLGYYGAFVRDADGNNVEAVCHTPE